MTDLEDTPKVSLGGVEYRVLPVPFREVSKILPLVRSVFAGVRINDLSEPTLEGLGKIIYYGVKRALPDLTYEAFIDLPASVDEMIAASIVVCSQAGLKRKDSAPGEATGEIIPLQTSTN